MLTKLDLKRDLKHLYNPSSKAFSVVEVPPMNYLMIDGQGDPNTSQDYKDAVEALYATAYTLKFAIKKAQAIDYSILALEGLWWVDNMAEFSVDRKDDWQWTMMIMQPDVVTAGQVTEAVKAVQSKKGIDAVSKLRFERYDEGTAVQILYFGPYKDEGPTIARMRAFTRENGYVEALKHHEIYLGDPRRTTPDKFKTVIRHPIRKVVAQS
jgi:hypothetical protein